MFQWIYHTDT